MNGLIAGFGRRTVNPPNGCGLSGYFVARYVDGGLDDLEISALALSLGGSTVILLSSDTVNIPSDLEKRLRSAVSSATGADEDAVFATATHTHTGPYLDLNAQGIPEDIPEKLTKDYIDYYVDRAVEAAREAVGNMASAEMSYSTTDASEFSFNRTFRMKDGTIRTNPGFNNPDVVEAVGSCDGEVKVLSFVTDNGETFVLVNYANHSDTVGGTKYSADWPGFMRRTVESTIPNAKCLFINGMEGDINHINVFPDEEYLSRVTMDFDDVPRGYAFTEHMGRTIAGKVIASLENAEKVPVETLKYLRRVVNVPTNVPTADEAKEAHRIDALHRAGRDSELPYEGMMLTTIVAEADRMVKLEYGPSHIEMTMTALLLGDIALVGVPGEPFNEIGVQLKKSGGIRTVFPCSLTNGDIGYFPMRDSYERGGYEARSSLFKAGVGELIIENGLEMIYEIIK